MSFPGSGHMKFSGSKKDIIWYKDISEISEEVKKNTPKVENGIYLVEGNI